MGENNCFSKTMVKVLLFLLISTSCKPTLPTNATASVVAPGINHLEFRVTDWSRSEPFYKGLLGVIQWRQIMPRGFTSGTSEIYFEEKKDLKRENTLGVRHICFQPTSRQMVEAVATYLKQVNARIIQGLQEMNYTKGYYTIDFYDFDGYVLEVAFTPNQNRGTK